MWTNPRIPFALSTERAPLTPPGGKPILVNLALNIEYWPFDLPMPRGVLPAPHGKAPTPPDVPNWVWVEYGMRSGMPRILKMLADRGLKASALLNAQVALRYPSLMEAILKAEWEMVGHGWFQRSMKAEPDERAAIERSLGKLREISGQPVRAWLGPGLGETEETPEILKENGVMFLHDWLVEDLPVWMRTKKGPMLAMPYAFALNDVPMYVIQNGPSDEWEKRVAATVEVFAEEAKEQPRVLTLSLHPHIIGVPHIAHWFGRTLDRLMARDDTVFMTSSQIGDWYLGQDPDGGAALEEFNDGPPAGIGFGDDHD
ncbi:MAG: polysaccharide deacetylase family protein [Pseudomonadota bacterium]